MSKRSIFVLIFVLAMSVLSFKGFFRVENSDISEPLTNREVALLCTTDMATEFHIHPNLTIIINGQKQEIPPNIGINVTCMNSIHTHEGGGVIHVESPIQRDFTLSDFFAVWGKPFDSQNILSFQTDDTHTIVVSVNGAIVDTFENTVLRDKDDIVISYQSK